MSATPIDTPPLATHVPASGSSRTRWRRLAVDGLWHRNAALVQLLGLCPLLAVSHSLVNAAALGLATLTVLLVSNTLIAALSRHLHDAIRLPAQVLVIATAVTLIERAMLAGLPELHAALGVFLPLIVTNCLILGRAEAFARRAPVSDAAVDALATGTGFAAVLCALGALRELIGRGTVFGDAAWLLGDAAAGLEVRLFDADHALLLALLPPGAFILLGLLLAALRALSALSVRPARSARPPRTGTDAHDDAVHR